ncbi:hypothetical protein BD413DRAFT_258039 [Trametes elegans]|nr:hypothetical protein BD413DRAFT_258039 [Trametes elegans]
MDRSRTRINRLLCSKSGCTTAVHDPEAVCSRCKLAYYCSRAHQFADLKRHKAHCINPAPTAALTQPQQVLCGERKVDVVLFPANGLPPQITSVTCILESIPVWHGLKNEWIDLRGLIDGPSAISGAVGSIRRSSTPHTRLYLICATRDTENPPRNMCIRRYTEGHNDVAWMGNVVGLRRREPATKFMQYFDVTDRDLAAFVAYSKDFGTGRISTIPDLLICQSSG